MKIDINEKYEKNILNVFGYNGADKFYKTFNAKEATYWELALTLIKKRPENTIWDDTLDEDALSKFLKLFLSGRNVEPFTIDDWFKYMKSK